MSVLPSFRSLFAGLVALLAASAVASAQEITLRVGHDQPVGSMYDEGHKMFKKLVEERSNGRIRVNVFPAGQLGAEVAMLEGVRLGTLDMSSCSAANAATVIPELGLLSVSYLFNDRAHVARVINDPKFSEQIDAIVAGKSLGLKRIGYYTSGVRNIYSRKGSVAGPEDLTNVKIRVQNNPVEVTIWKAFGAIPTPMNFGEVYQALQSGVIDAAENGLAVIESNKHYEAAKYISQTEHQYGINPVFMNERKLNSLPADLKAIVLQAAIDASVHERMKDDEFVDAAVEGLKTKGAVLTKPDKAKFIALVAPIQDKVAGDIKAVPLLETIRSQKK
ncbi:TRAP transporter substrate-binding protein [Bradyrhizobium sp. JYMT SZCCT0180]|uniref:TRAP transporter substrate-binding protein n=1 Tax=Bradyrhizobium sp. JYMT SZCCT0180 TaxID=2807666 RepID=UPI001BAA12EC|nr:TRAP transporter substrate-binding protein [Bradyrhizobium sp. JYMT SZCCT0180]MBR1215409.1 TRAP transporter substrate-binding protein [Bradyrhizobium sp. JYMT SZCCT0180]